MFFAGNIHVDNFSINDPVILQRSKGFKSHLIQDYCGQARVLGGGSGW